MRRGKRFQHAGCRGDRRERLARMGPEQRIERRHRWKRRRRSGRRNRRRSRCNGPAPLAPAGCSRRPELRSPAAPDQRRRRRPVSPSAFRRTSARPAPTILRATGSRAEPGRRPVLRPASRAHSHRRRGPTGPRRHRVRLGHHRHGRIAARLHADHVADRRTRPREYENATDRQRSGARERPDCGNRRRRWQRFRRYRGRRKHVPAAELRPQGETTAEGKRLLSRSMP